MFEESQALASRFRMTVDELGKVRKLLHSLRASMTREIKLMGENEGFVFRNKKDEIVKSVEEKQENEWYGMKVETLIVLYKQHAEFICDHHT